MTNETVLLTALMNGAEIKSDFQPQNNKQAYLAYLCGLDIALPEPRTAEEVLLYKLCVDGVGGGSAFTINDASNLFLSGARFEVYRELLALCKDVTSTSSMFKDCQYAKEIDLSGFDTSKVTTMRDMFSYCMRCPELDVSGFDTSNVTDMSSMFSGCAVLKSLDLTNFDTSKVTSMGYMFYTCWELEEIIGFSATNKVGITIMFPNGQTSKSMALKRLTFKNVPNAIRSAINISYCSFAREGMVEMFNSLPDISAETNISDANRTITIKGNPCVVGGEATLAEGDFVLVNNYEEACALFYGVPNDTEMAARYNGDGPYAYATVEDMLRAIKRQEFPLLLSWSEATYTIETLTDEDRAIATNKGWILVEG